MDLRYFADRRQSTQTDDVVSYIPQLRSFARSLTKDTVSADDLVQETLLKAIAKAHLYTPRTNMRAWLFTIMRNTFYSSISKRSSSETTGDKDCVSGAPATPATQEWSLRGKEMMAVNRLPSHYRQTLVLVVMLGESYEDSARICGCKVGTIKSRVARARSMVMEDVGPLD